jgi:hypothetical protein
MKLRYRLFRKSSGIFFIEDRINRKQEIPLPTAWKRPV